MRKLSVVHIISAMPMGGVETNLLRVLPRLNPEKFDVSLVCTRELGQLAQPLIDAGVPVELVHLRTRYDPRSLWNLRNYLKSRKADILQGHMRRANTSGRIAAMLAGVPVRIATEHDMRLGKKWQHDIVDRILARHTDAILGVTKAVCEINREHSGIAADKFRVMYLGLELEHLAKTIEKSEARKKLKIPFTENVIGFIGRLHEVKNVPSIIRSLAEDNLKHANLVIVGDGPERDNCEKAVEDAGVRERVHFCGYLGEADLPAVFSSFDVMAMASSSEGIATTQMEALASNCPLVTTPVGLAAEALTDGVEYIEVPTSSPADLAKGLAEALVPERAESLRKAGYEVIKNFSIEAQVKYLEDLYLELAQKHGIE